MATYTFYKRIFALLLTLQCSIISFSQESLVNIPLNKQVDLASQIVEGEVISKESFWNTERTHIYTKQTVKVYKVFKGQTFNTVEIITKGGVVDLEAEIVSHSLQLREGDLGVFILKQKNQGVASKGMINKSFEPISGVQGFYKYDLKTNKAVNPFNTISDIQNNFYKNVESKTKLKFTEVSPLTYLESLQSSKSSTTLSKTSAAPTITSFSSNSVTAGTKSSITINGTGFGSTQGEVGFSDANYGGTLFYNALNNQIISWSNSQIEVEVPDRAGTGPIQITTSVSETITSSQNLIIDFAQVNLEYADDAYQTQHIESNSNGGNTWVMNQDFYNSGAKDAFTRAFNNWVCNTGVNWEISSSTSGVNTNASDNINIITFDSSMSSGTLGQCYSRYSGCYEDGVVKWYVTEMDIVFNPNKNWNYSTNPPAYDEVDFETVAIHELGHGHQLGHVIDTNEVMHYSVSSGESSRSLSTEDLNGALDVQSRSTATTVCSQSSMTMSTCYQSSLSTDDAHIEDAISVYPNPTSSNVFVKVKRGLNIERTSIYNLEGRQVYNSFEKHTNALKSISTSQYAKGIYIIKIDTDLGSISKKLIIN